MRNVVQTFKNLRIYFLIFYERVVEFVPPTQQPVFLESNLPAFLANTPPKRQQKKTTREQWRNSLVEALCDGRLCNYDVVVCRAHLAVWKSQFR